MIFDTADPVPPLLSAPGVSFADLAGLTRKGPVAAAKKDAGGIQFRSLGAKRAEKDGTDGDDVVSSSRQKAKSLSAADEDDDSDDEDDDNDDVNETGPLAAARRRERSRCAAILGCKAAAKNLVLAANIAFRTSMPRSEAIALLQDSPAATTTSRHEDREGRNPKLGSDGGGMAADQSARMVARMRAARGLPADADAATSVEASTRMAKLMQHAREGR